MGGYMFKRYLTQKVFDQHKNKKISIILGARQVGKTTILKYLYQKLGGLFIDADLFSDYEKISTYENFLNTLRLNGYSEIQKNFFYVFIDEFQRYDDITKIFKNIYDHHSNIKIYATGSSSLEIKNLIQESLAGRKIITHLYPLCFEEYLIFKQRPELIDKIKNLNTIKLTKNYFKLIPEIKPYFEDFLIWGGYPEVALVKQKDKIEVLQSIFDLFVKKDLKDFVKPEKLNAASMFIKLLAINNGCITNYQNMATKTQLDNKTIKNYLEILKETFLINIIPPYYSNKTKELTKTPKIYFIDNGICNYFCNNFNEINLRNNAGLLFEGYILSEMLKNGIKSENIKYYRTKYKTEIDFILEKNQKLVPIEIKYKTKIDANDSKTLTTFLDTYQITKAYLINLGVLATKDKIKHISCFDQSFFD
jgi:uncharacterized protein